MWAIAFHPDGKHFWGRNLDGIRRWRTEDGEEVGRQMGMAVIAISVSRNNKWIICGTMMQGVSVWDAKLQEKTGVEVEDAAAQIDAIDIAPDSTRLATARYDNHTASVWSITTGERLVGPLQHDGAFAGIGFSPNGERVATTCLAGSVRIFDSRNGNQLNHIDINIRGSPGFTPLAWSDDGQRIFVASREDKVVAFDATAASQLAEWQVLTGNGEGVRGVALTANGRFIATVTNISVSFLDASTLAQIGPAILNYDESDIWSFTLSPGSSHLAIGGSSLGKIAIRDLSNIMDLVGFYYPITVRATLMA